MKNFLVLFREPDDRTVQHPEDDLQNHQLNWKNWREKWGKEGKLTGGSALTLNGRIIEGNSKKVIKEIHKTGAEIVGGYLLIKASDIDEATEIVKSCPIFEFGGYAEIREPKS